ncbi:hypothetical protein OQA88_7461 [Cercophora sp. LCS_1]
MMRQGPPLLPAPDPAAGENSDARTTALRVPAPPSQQALARQQKRRTLNKFACHMCQKKKTRCDGERPFCSACLRRKDKQCEYPVREGAVSRYADLKQTYQQLEQENHKLKNLFASLRSRPENEASEIYRRLRNSDDPFKTLQQFQDAETLLMLPMASGSTDIWMNELDAEALSKSPIKVSARPWTSAAGDGIVSSLISAFFKWDDALLYSFVDRELFLRDMKRGDPHTAQYCSPLLVNAICATRAVLSEKVKLVERTTGRDIGAAFVAEAKRHLDKELARSTITTVQGLYMLLALSCCDGTNRTGAIYRFAAMETLRRLNPERAFLKLNPGFVEEASQRRALSKLCWGLFIFERQVKRVPIFPPPNIPPVHDEGHLIDFNLDVVGHAFIPGSPLPPIVPGVAKAASEAAQLLHSITMYNHRPSEPIGGPEDMRIRNDYLSRVNNMEAFLPRRLRYNENPAPGTLFLKLFTNVGAFSILRPLPPHVRMAHEPRTTTKTLLIRLCALNVDVMELYVRHYSLVEYSPMIFVGMWSVACTLISMLPARNPSPVRPDDDTSILDMIPDLFTRACGMMSILARDMPSIKLVMQGLLALAHKTDRVMPVGARQYFDGVEKGMKGLRDVPVNTVLPVLEAEDKGEGLAELLEGWNLS